MLENIEIGNTGDLIDDVDMRSNTKCTGCGHNKSKGTTCDLTKKWCYISIKSCIRIEDVKLGLKLNGPKPGLWTVIELDEVMYIEHNKTKEVYLLNQKNLLLFSGVKK